MYSSIARHQNIEKLTIVEYHQKLLPVFKFSRPKCDQVNSDLFLRLIIFLNTAFPCSNYRNLISIPIELNSNFSVRFNGAVPE